MPLLGAAAPGAPLEEHGALGAAADVDHRVAGHAAGRFGDRAVLGVDVGRGLLHEEPVAAAGPGAGEVGVEGALLLGALVGRRGVGVERHDVYFGGPLPVVDRDPLPEHEVRGDRDLGVRGAEDFALLFVVLEHRVRGEPLEVEFVRGVGEVLGRAGREDLLPVAVVLAPERAPPGGVQRFEAGVLRLQPKAEGPLGVLGVGGRAVLVVDVPHRERRVLGVAFGELRRDAVRGLAVGGRADVVGVARAVDLPHPVGAGVERVRVREGEPRRRRGGRGGEVDGDAPGVELAEDGVEPAEVVFALARFEPRPGEDADADEVDPRLAHQHDVVVPDLFGPLLGVVVAAVAQAVDAFGPVHGGPPRMQVTARRDAPWGIS